ncbi:MAG: hypothetical protein EPO08_20800 [Rhodospirillaceae bacterium]|nr:MAG: hypothetical protein EPO08_20800 [Rhodospirillaceae bacterium]
MEHTPTEQEADNAGAYLAAAKKRHDEFLAVLPAFMAPFVNGLNVTGKILDYTLFGDVFDHLFYEETKQAEEVIGGFEEQEDRKHRRIERENCHE